MAAPQSDAEIRPVVEALRRLDPLLDLRWNPRARLVQRGGFDAWGQARPGTYDGRWEVIRHQTPHTAAAPREGQFAVLWRVEGEGAAEGTYRPIGDWLVTFMQRWDAAQAHYRDEMDRAWARHERANAGRTDEGAYREGLERSAFRQNYSGGRGIWHGGGFDPQEVS